MSIIGETTLEFEHIIQTLLLNICLIRLMTQQLVIDKEQSEKVWSVTGETTFKFEHIMQILLLYVCMIPKLFMG